MIYFQISDVHDFSNLWAEHFCFAPITWSSMDDLRVGRPSGQTNYLHKWHVFHKDESHTFNQPLLMIGNNLTDCTKFAVVVMSCEDFDYSKKVVTTSLHTLSGLPCSMNDIYIFHAMKIWFPSPRLACVLGFVLIFSVLSELFCGIYGVQHIK